MEVCPREEGSTLRIPFTVEDHLDLEHLLGDPPLVVVVYFPSGHRWPERQDTKSLNYCR